MSENCDHRRKIVNKFWLFKTVVRTVDILWHLMVLRDWESSKIGILVVAVEVRFRTLLAVCRIVIYVCIYIYIYCVHFRGKMDSSCSMRVVSILEH